MSTVAPVPFWGPRWGTSTTTTTDIARRNAVSEEVPANAQKIVYIVAPERASSIRSRSLRYKVSESLSKLMPLILEAPTGMFALTHSAHTLSGPSEVDPRAWRGVFSIHAPRKVLFTQNLELHTATLRRLKPRIYIDRRTSERDDA